MIGWLILAAVLALCAVLCIRAARFKPEAGAGAAPTPVAVDTEGAVQRLAQMVRIPTVSNYDAEKFDETQFEGFREKLRELYPRVHAMCPPVRIAHTGMLFHWKGKSSAAPVVLMAHYDVVPVDEAGWKHPPFCGEVFDGELWGRGTLDTKITLLGILEAAERLMRPADSHESGFCHTPCIGAAPHPMGRVLKGHAADAVFLGQFHGTVRTEQGVGNPDSKVAVVILHRAPGSHQLRLAIQVNPTFLHIFHKTRDAVKSVALNTVRAGLGVDGCTDLCLLFA